MKQAEIKNLTDIELTETLLKTQSQLQNLKMTHVLSPIESPIDIRLLRRTVARIKTEIRKRELDEISN